VPLRLGNETRMLWTDPGDGIWPDGQRPLNREHQDGHVAIESRPTDLST
jgi:hypothetical protein